jgi:hypothetical protein
VNVYKNWYHFAARKSMARLARMHDKLQERDQGQGGGLLMKPLR